MPTVTLNRKVVDAVVGKKLQGKELAERISYLGTDLEKITKDEIVVEVFPSRPDMLSEQGFGRALAAFVGARTGIPAYKVKRGGYAVRVDRNVTMRPYTCCAVVTGLTFDDERIREVMQVQEKLALTHGRNRRKSAYGLYPAAKIAFPIRYVAKDPRKVLFRPLGEDKLRPAIWVEENHKTGKAWRHVTDGWKEYPFFIDAKENVLCMLPYTNSDDTGRIDLDTSEVFIECTGNDFENVHTALCILSSMLADMGGTIHSVEMKYHNRTIHTPDFTPKKMRLDVKYISRLLGVGVDEGKAKRLLRRMGMDVEGGKALIPRWRYDILHQADLAEECAIAYGYENVPEIIPDVATVGGESRMAKMERTVRELLVGLGMLECKAYHLTNREAQCQRMRTELPLVTLKSAVNQGFDVLVAWNVPLLLEVLGRSTHHEYPQILFLSGRVFAPGTSETGVVERDHLAVVRCAETADYTHARQVLEYLLRMLRIDAKVVPAEHSSFITGRVAEVKVGKEKVGILGEMHPAVLKSWEIPMPVAALELDLGALSAAMRR